MLRDTEDRSKQGGTRVSRPIGADEFVGKPNRLTCGKSNAIRTTNVPVTSTGLVSPVERKSVLFWFFIQSDIKHLHSRDVDINIDRLKIAF